MSQIPIIGGYPQFPPYAPRQIENYLYAMGQDGCVKIGIAISLEKRRAQIQTSCPFRVQIIHAEPMGDRSVALREETLLHDMLKQFGRHLWGEWFRISLNEAHSYVKSTADFGRDAEQVYSWRSHYEARKEASA